MQASIFIPTYNRQKYLKRCLQSIQKHTAEEYEIIFINNGTTQGGLKWLQSICRETKNCQLVDTRGPGYADRVHRAMQKSSGEYIVLLQNDVTVTAHWVDRMLDLLVKHSHIGCVGPMTNNVNGIQNIGFAESLPEDQIDSFARDFELRNRNRRISATELSGVCVAYRRKHIEKIGGFDSRFKSQNLMIEDFCLQSRLAGFKIAIAADVFVYHANTHRPEKLAENNPNSTAEDRIAFHRKWSYLDQDTRIGMAASVLKIIEKGSALSYSGQTEKAVEILSKGARYLSENHNLALSLAEALAEAGDYRQAIGISDGLVSSENQDLRCLIIAGQCHYGSQRFEVAENCADRILAVEPAYAPALNLKGLMAARRGDNESAVHFYQESIACDPGYGPAHTNLGILKQKSGQIPEALELLEKGFILAADNGDAAVEYHSAAVSLKPYDRAELAFREAVDLYPNHKQLLYFLIDILLKSQKIDSAMERIKQAMVRFGLDDGILEAALAIRPQVKPKMIASATSKRPTLSLCMIAKNEENHLARCLLSVDAIVDEIIVVDTGSTDRTTDIATVFGAHVEAFEWTDDFSAARNASLASAAGDWVLILDADEVLNSSDCADLIKLISQFSKNSIAYEFVTRNYTTNMNLIGWKSNDGLYPKEEAGCGWTSSEKVRLFPNRAAIRFQYPVHELVEPSLKRIGVTVQRCRIPVHHYGKLIQKTTTAKIMPYFRLGKKKMAELEGDAGAIRELAIQTAIVGDHHGAVDLWNRFIALQPNICDGYVHIGASYSQLGQYEAALTASEKALTLDPERQEARYNYAISQLYLGNAPKAVEALEHILQRNPDYLPAVFMLSAAYCCMGRHAEGVLKLGYLKKTAIGSELSFRCLDLARCMILRQLLDYASRLLDAAIESKVVSEEARSLQLNIVQLKNAAPVAHSI